MEANLSVLCQQIHTLVLRGSKTDRKTEKHNVLGGGNYKLEIRSVERGICPIDNSTMNQLFP